MRIIMRYSSGDGCTYWCENIVPIIYESAEAAIVDFEKAMSCPNEYGDFMFASEEFYRSDFVVDGKMYMPEFMTVDEWFGEKQ